MSTQEQPPKRSKHRAIVGFFQEGIDSGKFREGARLPSEAELVKQFGASRPTVSKAMRDLQSSGLINRRAGSGSFVSARSPAEKTGQLFGVLIPRLGETEIFEAICGQIAREAEVGSHGLFWSDLAVSGDARLVAERTCEPYLRQRVAGVFFAPLELSDRQAEVNQRIAAKLDEAGIPIVLLDRDFERFPLRSKYDLVGTDNYAAGYLLAQHLIGAGCGRVTFIARPYSASTVDLRIAGAFSALAAAGRRPEDGWVGLTDGTDSDAVKTFLHRTRTDGVICANDKTAAELMHSLGKLGVDVPGDVKVVGIDDVHYARLLRPALTTIHQPCREIGTVAMQTMLDRVASPKSPVRQIMLPVGLVVRQSSGNAGR